mgnify:CR=1 FL=1
MFLLFSASIAGLVPSALDSGPARSRERPVIRRCNADFSTIAALICLLAGSLLPPVVIAQQAPAGVEPGGTGETTEERLVIVDLFDVRAELYEFVASVGNIDTEAYVDTNLIRHFQASTAPANRFPSGAES